MAFAMLKALVTIIRTRSCGEETITISSTGKRLEYRQRHITGSWRHINKQEVQFAPDHIAPELFYHIGNDRTSPDHRILFVWNQKVQGHDLDPILCDNRDDPVVISHCRSVKTIHFGNGGTCDIVSRIPIANLFLPYGFAKVAVTYGFTHAAFSADHTDDVSYIRINILFYQKAGLLGGTSSQLSLCAALIAAAFFLPFLYPPVALYIS